MWVSGGWKVVIGRRTAIGGEIEKYDRCFRVVGVHIYRYLLIGTYL